MYKSILDEAINLKMKEFENRKINIQYSNIKQFLREVYFRNQLVTREKLINFVYEDNIEDIVSFLMSDAVINPKF